MKEEKKKFYITTTLPYVNAEPHIGFALEIIQADVIARYHRQKGEDVFFNFGTDEHGLKIYRKSQEEGKNPREYCDEYAGKFNKLKEALNLSYNNFIRTTDSHHIKAAQEFWKRCEANGDIYKKDYKVKYCVGCEMEKTESELENGRCPFHPNKELEIIEEENYFFRYSKYQDKLLKLYKDNPEFVLPDFRLNEIIKFTEGGLEDFSISRLKEKMPWGVPVPGDDKHIVYVWFDALVNYISCLGWPDNLDKFNDFWPGIQVAGKDNLRQQSSMWQAMLMSAGLPNSKQVLIHGFITSGSKKISKSLGNVTDPFEIINKYGTDPLRYYLLREISPFQDGDFTLERFETRYNDDLSKGLGNLVSRVVKMAEKMNLDNERKISSKIQEELEKTKKEYSQSLEEFKFNDALVAIFKLISFSDKYIEKEKPWEEKENSKQVITDLLFLLEEISRFLKPFLPETAEKIEKYANLEEKVKPLFPRLKS